MNTTYYTDQDVFLLYKKALRKSRSYVLVSFILFLVTLFAVFQVFDLMLINITFMTIKIWKITAIIGAILLGIAAGISFLYDRTANQLMYGKAQSSSLGWALLLIGLVVLPLLTSYAVSKIKYLD